MEILTQVLRLEHRDAGLYLEEDDHILYLKRGDEVLARWSSTGATIGSIRNEADRYIHSKEEANDILASIKPPYKYGPAELPEFRDYAQRKYPNALDEDLITMIEDLIARGHGDKDHG